MLCKEPQNECFGIFTVCACHPSCTKHSGPYKHKRTLDCLSGEECLHNGSRVTIVFNRISALVGVSFITLLHSEIEKLLLKKLIDCSYKVQMVFSFWL